MRPATEVQSFCPSPTFNLAARSSLMAQCTQRVYDDRKNARKYYGAGQFAVWRDGAEVQSRPDETLQ